MKTTKQMTEMTDTLARILDKIKKIDGVDHAEASYSVSEAREVGVRMGQIEKMETAESLGVSMQAWIGNQTASTSLSSLSPDDIDAAIASMHAAIKLAEQDPERRPLDPSMLATIRHNDRLDLYDPRVPTAGDMLDRARTAESAALSVAKITNSEGGSASWHKSTSVSLDTDGVIFTNRGTFHSMNAVVIAEENGAMERDYDYGVAIHGNDLPDAATIGRNAGTKAAAALNPQKGLSGRYPVLFAPDMAAGLLGHFASAVQGGVLRYKRTFMNLDEIGTELFAPGITIIDNPHLKRGLGSKMYNGLSMATQNRTLVENGVLRGVFMGLKDSRHFGMAPTGGASNLTIEPGMKLAEMFADIKDGLYVTGLMGQGINLINGDYSRAAQGFWIRDGQIAFAVSNVPIAGNLREMFKHMVAADDLDRFKRKVSSPTLRIDGMTIA